MRRSLRRALTGATLAVCTAMSILAMAETKKKDGRDERAERSAVERAKPVKVSRHPAAASPSPSRADAGHERAMAAVGDAGGVASDAGVVASQKAGDGGAQVFRFSEVEVEGRLKSPQIVYFLRRVRAEFAATDLGHRSFSHELRETRDDPAFE